MATELGRRERKRLQTREAIASAALELFSERGFHDTTIADITERADVSRRTFFSYFPAKEDVVFADFPAALVAFRAHLARREGDATVFDALRTWLPHALAAKAGRDDAQERCRRSLVDQTPQLDDRRRALTGQFVDLIAAEAARDLGVDRSDLRAQLVGSAAATAMTIIEAQDSARSDEEAFAQLEQVIEFLRGGLQALRDAG